MGLEIRRFHVDDARLADMPTRLVDRRLLINTVEAHKLLSHECLERVDLEIVRPGERVRIINLLDMVQPIASETKTVFPGFLGDPLTVGHGVTDRLEGFRVLGCGAFPQPQSTSLTTKDGLIDMAGPGARMCLGSDTVNLVVAYHPKPDTTNEEFDAAARTLTLTLARYLAQATHGLEADEATPYDLSSKNRDLPNIFYVNQLQDQGPLISAYLYGRRLGEDFVSTVLDPLELMDGAIVSGNFRNCMKKPTSLHTNDPIVNELLRGHGQDLNFKGVILSRGHHGSDQLKLRSASYVAKLARFMEADGVVLGMEGTGNGTVDFFLTLEQCEKAGVRTVGVVHELGGSSGEDSPLVYSSSYADALVSTGGVEREFTLPRVDRVIGGGRFLDYSLEPRDPYGEFRARPLDLYGSFWKMSVAGYTCVDA